LFPASTGSVWAFQSSSRPDFLGPLSPSTLHHGLIRRYAKAKKGSGDSGGKNKKPPSSSMRGFGVFTSNKKSTSSSSSNPEYELIIEPDVLEMVRWLQNNGASVSGLALARFPKKENLRGESSQHGGFVTVFGIMLIWHLSVHNH